MPNRGKMFIWKWMIAIFVGTVALLIGSVGFMIHIMEMGIVFSLFAVAFLIWYIAFVPHSFLFDNEKITIIYVFKTKSVRYVHIKNCNKEESGIRNYPWGMYYHIIVDKPIWQEFKILSTRDIDWQIKRYVQ